MVNIGLSPSFLPPDPERRLWNGRSLTYLETSMVEWVRSSGARPWIIPSAADDPETVAQSAADLFDGLILTGGVDVDPSAYGEVARRPEWQGDRARDRLDRALVGAFRAAKKPILGICRGHQILNVAFGGTLHQDLEEALGVTVHRNPDRYDGNRHPVDLIERGWLASWLGASEVIVNSIHHQGIDRLGDGLVVEARSSEGLIEAVRSQDPPFACGVQWHPEMERAGSPGEASGRRILEAFLSECRAARDATGSPGRLAH